MGKLLQNFQDTFEIHKRFISGFSICMTVPKFMMPSIL